ncbi:hypothetical protein AAG614_01465 [Citromicrobium bathyomarinum]
MHCPPYVLREEYGLCFWVLLSEDGMRFVRQSEVGFETEEEAIAHFKWWHAT